MVIQRWQTVFLFISLVLVSIFSVSNFGTIEDMNSVHTVVNASSNIGYWLYNLAIVLILLISIFMFKKQNVQKLLVLLSAAMMGGSAMWGYNYLHFITPAQSIMHYSISWVLLIVAFGLSLCAYFLILSDQRLLKSADRLR